MKISRYIYSAIALIGLAACTAEQLPDPVNKPQINPGEIEVIMSVAIPDMGKTVTRGLFGETPGANLKLTLLEFTNGVDADGNPDGANSFLTNVYRAETTSATNVSNNGLVKFKVTLKSSTEGRRLHLLVSDDFINTDYGSESSIFPNLTVSGSNEAYWGKVTFDQGYNTVDDDGNITVRTDLKTKLQNVPVVRNFCKITVTENLGNFNLEGFEIVNVPTAGTIVPWNQEKQSVPSLLNGTAMQPFATAMASYPGVVPAMAGFTNQESDIRKLTGNETSTYWSGNARYLYEHPFESSRHTYLIIRGNYYNANTGTWSGQTFYKVDLGSSNNDGTFTFYPLLRNYSFNVVITEVNAAGAASPSAAIDGPTFNNISADTKTTGMLNVSDGDNMLAVNATSVIFVKEDEPFTLRYQYITDVTTDKTVNNNSVTVSGLKTGDVIKSYTEGTDGVWKTITITPKQPLDDGRSLTQQFTITDNKGLGRVITLVLNKPWDFSGFLTQPGIKNLPDGTASQNISTAAGQQLTLYFNLPDGIPEAVFPLQFTIEADRQDIENNKIGTLVVKTGPSLFNPAVPAISYVKTVSYEEYLYQYSTEGAGNAVDVSKRNVNHTVRCRFLTTTAGTGVTNIKVSNSYFNEGSTSFTRAN